MSKHVISLPGTDYEKIIEENKTMIILPASERLTGVQVNDWLPVIFDESDKKMLIEILEINFTRFTDLNKRIAVKCGYSDVSSLKQYLLGKYPSVDNQARLYTYSFMLMGTSEKVGE